MLMRKLYNENKRKKVANKCKKPFENKLST